MRQPESYVMDHHRDAELTFDELDHVVGGRDAVSQTMAALESVLANLNQLAHTFAQNAKVNG
jgi:hypothetical protein